MLTMKTKKNGGEAITNDITSQPESLFSVRKPDL